MAQIVWKEEASSQFEKHIDYALAEYGKKAVRNWYRDVQRIENRMSAHPESFSLEPLLIRKSKPISWCNPYEKFQAHTLL